MASEKYSYVAEEHALITNICVGLVMLPVVLLSILLFLVWTPVALLAYFLIYQIVRVEKYLREQPTRT